MKRSTLLTLALSVAPLALVACGDLDGSDETMTTDEADAVEQQYGYGPCYDPSSDGWADPIMADGPFIYAHSSILPDGDIYTYGFGFGDSDDNGWCEPDHGADIIQCNGDPNAVWARYQLNQANTVVRMNFGTVDACENSDLTHWADLESAWPDEFVWRNPDGGFAICAVLDDGEVVAPGPSDCDHTY